LLLGFINPIFSDNAPLRLFITIAFERMVAHFTLFSTMAISSSFQSDRL